MQEVFKGHLKIAYYALHENEAQVWKCLKQLLLNHAHLLL